MSRAVPFEVHPTEPLRLVATLADGSKCAVEIRLAVVEVVDNERTLTQGGRLVPDVEVRFHPLVAVALVGTEVTVPSIVSGKPN